MTCSASKPTKNIHKSTGQNIPIPSPPTRRPRLPGSSYKERVPHYFENRTLLLSYMRIARALSLFCLPKKIFIMTPYDHSSILYQNAFYKRVQKLPWPFKMVPFSRHKPGGVDIRVSLCVF
ncbi:hypothetical protein NC652_009924 [Populus alba x Populus x berolinensis]|nr:hypothetical protein NC652_009924 [Populus alba x Populus x berolinensis]